MPRRRSVSAPLANAGKGKWTRLQAGTSSELPIGAGAIRARLALLLVDTVLGVYTLTCPNCGGKEKVPFGLHTVVQTPAPRGKLSGITIDGKSVRRYGLIQLTPVP
jgi:hypothetical protein